MGNTVLNKIENAGRGEWGLREGLSGPVSLEDNAGHVEASPATSGQRESLQQRGGSGCFEASVCTRLSETE